MIPRRTFLAIAALGVAGMGRAAATESGTTQKGREFLAKLFDPDLGLLPEYRGARVYWLSHDNYLAARVLKESHPDISRSIIAAIEKEGLKQSDGKTELVIGEQARVLPFCHYSLTDVRKVGEKVIRTEMATEQVMNGWEQYVDLLCLASIAEGRNPAGQRHWEAVVRLWDGSGFNDVAAQKHQQYATYKLALALIAGSRRQASGNTLEAIREKLLLLQDESGGWVTDYDRDGKQIGVANVETTCLAILGLEEFSKLQAVLSE
jgi:hypothetical protein